MTVPSNVAKTQYTGNGTTVSFSTGFVFQEDAHVRVVLTTNGVDVQWTNGVEYTVMGAGSGLPGTVTAAIAPVAGALLTIFRNMPFTQTLDAGMLETLSASELEDSLDSAMMCLTQLKEKVDRAIVASETGGVAVITGWSPIFALASDGSRRVLQVIDWVGGSLPKPAVGAYVGTAGLVTSILSGVDVRGPQGTSGAGSGDVLSSQNLLDIGNVVTAFNNIKQAASETATGVVELATNPEVLTGTDTVRAVTPSGVAAAIAASTIAPESFNDLSGLVLSNAVADTVNDITVGVGKCVDLTTGAVMNLNPAITKRLDASWVAGNGQGGRDQGVITDFTWHVYLIMRSDTGETDVLFSMDQAFPLMPSAQWDCKRRIGSVIRKAGTILQFSQVGDEFLFRAANGDINVAGLSTTAILYTLTVPFGLQVHALVRGTVTNTNGATVLVTSPDENDQLIGTPPGNGTGNGNVYFSSFYSGRIRTNTSAQIRARSSAAATVFRANTYGYIDRRGRDD